MCRATKGADGDLRLAFTNTEANWAGTLYSSKPYDTEPSFAGLIGWSMQMLHPDLLHLWHLGCGRDVAGSVLSVLVRQRGVFRGRNIKKRLRVATNQLQQFAKAEKLTLSRKTLTVDSLCLKTGVFPELHASGFDTAIVTKWLAQLVQSHEVDPEIATVVWVANNILSLLSNSGRFLSQEEQLRVRTLGKLFMHTYLNLAHKAIVRNSRLWRVRPKLHLFDHICRMDRPSGVNPHFFSTWMDEDAVKKFMRVNSLTHKSTTAQRVLQRWLLGLPGTFGKLQ